jgi:hypothetical protein
MVQLAPDSKKKKKQTPLTVTEIKTTNSFHRLQQETQKEAK